MTSNATVVAVCLSDAHSFSKLQRDQIELLRGLGVSGDAHCGEFVKHKHLTLTDPKQKNLRQVHLLALELLDELNRAGFSVQAGDMGENITTGGIDLINLPFATRLQIGKEAILKVTGLRSPCHQIDDFQKGLLSKVVAKDKQGKVIRKTGIMTTVEAGGLVSASDKIRVILPPAPHRALEVV